ncbi:hypothetical protein FBUS_01615 [Fasciolopsis buskii]|uniref:Uncharacterized protein n=1 Tax=Fasciolopsis buskii TaxID=27845 RepID=A0A8E0VN60_9TREM|nr:hypothetical protein FBUS_01615 [Fasciolopsis buski]
MTTILGEFVLEMDNLFCICKLRLTNPPFRSNTSARMTPFSLKTHTPLYDETVYEVFTTMRNPLSQLNRGLIYHHCSWKFQFRQDERTYPTNPGPFALLGLFLEISNNQFF